MEDCKTLELSIEETKIYAENYKYLEGMPNEENLLKTRRKSNNSICSSATTLASDHAETPQSCGSICVFNLHQKLIFNCEFCDLKYGDLDNFGRHLFEAHNLLLQTEEPAKENASNESRSSPISNVVKKEPLEPAIDLSPSYFTEPLVSCGNVFILKERRFLMACGYCDCSNYDNLKIFEKHIKSQHNILEGAHNELNVVPKVEEIVKEEFIAITELEKAKIKEENEEVKKKLEAKIKEEQNSKKHEDSDEENDDEEIESGEEFQDIESGEEEEEDEDDEESDFEDDEDDDDDDDEEFMDEEESSTSSSKTKCKRLSSADEPSTSTASKKDTTRKKKKNKKALSTEENPYACEHCDTKFKSKYYLKLHITGENNYECKEHCNKKHLERRKTYLYCDICDKKFTTKYNFTTHKRLHTGEKPFKCDICHTQYAANSSLWEHKKRWHLGEAGKSFKCQYCDKKFMYNHEIIRHIRVHTGEKPFECDVCNKFYSSIKYLSQHKKLHSRQLKTLKCDYCDKSYIRSSDRNRHMRVHTEDKPIKCDVCQRCYVRKDGLRRHAKKRHPETVNKLNDIV